MSKVAQFIGPVQKLLHDTCKAGIWHSSQPYSLGTVKAGDIGFAHIPVVGLRGLAKDPFDLIPVLRQEILSAMDEAGLPTSQTSPTVLVGIRRRARIATDENPDSPTCGKRKRMREFSATIEVLDRDLFAECKRRLGETWGF